LTDEYRNT